MKIIVALCITVFVYIIQDKIYRNSWYKNLSISFRFDREIIECGQNARLELEVSNEKRIPLPVLHVKFSAPRYLMFDDAGNSSVTDYYYRNDAFSVMGNQRVRRTLDFKGEKRGYYSISKANVIAKNFFMTGTYAKTMYDRTHIYVLPRKINDVGFDVMVAGIIGDIETKSRLYYDPYTFRGMREYTSTDSMSDINWKATAKTGCLMVNVHNNTAMKNVKLLLNLDTNLMVREEYIKELCIELTSSLAFKLTQSGIPVGLTSNGYDEDNRALGSLYFGATQYHMLEIDKYLARINRGGKAAEFLEYVNCEISNADDSQCYIIVSAYYRAELLQSIDELYKRGCMVYMLVPHYDIDTIEADRPYIYEWKVLLNDT